MFFSIFLPKNLVSSEKSSTFAPVFAPTASEQKIRAKMQKNVMLKISHLQRKCKKVTKKFGQSKKKQYLCSRFRDKRKVERKSTVIFERLKQ